MIRRRNAGCSTRTTKARRTPRWNLALTLGLLALIACGSAAWRCEVTVVLGEQTVTGVGTGDRREVALAAARRDACGKLELDDAGVRRCETGENPGSGTWSITDECTET